MKEYIERAQLLKNLGYDEKRRADVLPGSTFDIVLKEPTADVAPVRHGRWIDKGWDGDFSWQISGRGSCWRVYECSECQCKTKRETDYCPFCNAKMDKEDEHEQIGGSSR